jgi:hypothetical protein
MEKQTIPKLKITIPLLIAAIATQALSLITFSNINTLVHRDLYNYGLQFDSAWNTIYWNNSNLFSTLLSSAITLSTITIAIILLYIKINKPTLKLAAITALLTAVILNLISVYIFTRVEQVIHGDLYNYGLQYNPVWAETYLAHTFSLFTSMAIASTIMITALILIYSITPKTITPEKPETTKIRKEKPQQAKIEKEEPKVIKRITKTTIKEPSKIASLILIPTGTAVLIASIFYASSILAFISLGLLFWGILFTYIRTEEYTKKALLDTVSYPQITTINQILQELNFEGTPIYLPPKYFKNPETQKAYIPKNKTTILPTPEQIQQQETQIFTKNPPSILITPPGAELAKLFEKTLDINFARVDLPYLQQNLPKLIIEDLEIAKNFEIETKNNKINITIEDSSYSNPHSEDNQPPYPLTSILSSAIASTLAKTTGNPITIEKQQTSPNNKTITIEYSIIQQEEQTKP